MDIKTTPPQHNLLSEVPRRRFGRIISFFFGGMFILGLVAGGYWYFVMYEPDPPPVISKVSEPTVESDIQPIVAYLVASPKPNQGGDTPGAGVYSVDFLNKKVEELFLQQGVNQSEIIGVTNEFVYFRKPGTGGKGYQINKYVIRTKKIDVLVQAEDPATILTGFLLSPDKKTMLYTEGCGLACKDQSAYAHSYIKQVDLETGKTKVVYSFISGRTWFTFGRQWSNNNLVLMDYSCECDGIGPSNQAELLNLDNGNLITVTFNKPVSDVTLSPDGKNLLAVRLDVAQQDQPESSYVSSVLVKDITEGGERTVLSSDSQFFEGFDWLTDSKIIGKSIHSKTVKLSLGYYAEGAQDLLVYDIGDEIEQTILVSKSKSTRIFGFAYPYVLYAKTWPLQQDIVFVDSLTARNLESEEEFELLVPSMSAITIIK